MNYIEYAFRVCQENGSWAERGPEFEASNGWTNYTPCFPPVIKDLLNIVSKSKNETQVLFKCYMLQSLYLVMIPRILTH